MLRQKSWDQYEIALLIECYVNVTSQGKELEVELIELSENLRSMAVHQGETIDETYRNLNGMHWQYQFIKSAFNNGTVGSRTPPKLFVEMVQLFLSDKQKFDSILMEAHQLARDYISTMDNKQEEFAAWIQATYGNKYSVKICLECISDASDYAVNHHITKANFWDINDYKEFNRIRVKMSGSRIFRFFNRSLYKNFDRIGKLYSDFLKEVSIQSAPKQDISKKEASDTLSTLDQVYPADAVKELLPQASDIILNQDNYISEQREDKETLAQTSDNIKNLDQYAEWLIQVRQSSNVTARLYISSIKSANRFALSHQLIAVDIWVVRDDFLKSSVQSILSDEEFYDYNASQHNRFSAALKSYVTFRTGEILPLTKKRKKRSGASSPIDTTQAQKMVDCTESIKNLLLTKFPYGLRTDSIIDIMKFKHYAEEEHVEFTANDDLLKVQILNFGITCEGKSYFISDESCSEIMLLLDSIFDAGHSIIYYENLYNLHQELFEKCHVYSQELLGCLLEKKFPLIYTAKNFITKNSSRLKESDAVEFELARVWGDSVRHSYDELYERLPYIPDEKIRFYLSYTQKFVWSSPETFVAIDKFIVTDTEKEAIYSYVKNKCNTIGYASINDVPLGNIVEENYDMSITAIYDIIYRVVLKEDFALTGKILTHKNKSVDILTIAKAYCVGKDACTFSELNEYVTFVNGTQNRQVTFQAAYDQFVRIDETHYVADKFVNFSVSAIDDILEKVLDKGFAPIKSIASFALFPDCNFSWNHYILESYCYRYSKKFRLSILNFNDKNAGIIIKKDMTLGYYDILAIAAANSSVELTNSAVGQYLCEAGYTSKKSMKALDGIVEKAKTLREAK